MIHAESRPVGRPTRRYPPDRRCASDGCATVLSTYTRGLLCGVHEEPRPYHTRGRRVEPGIEPTAKAIERSLGDPPLCLAGAD